MNKKLIFQVLIILLIFGIAKVSAIGVTPGKTSFDYTGGESRTVEVTVVNSDKKDINIAVLVQGELAPHISVSQVSFKMAASETEKKITYVLKMPQGMKPGPHLGEIVIVQLPEQLPSGDAFVGASVAVITQVQVFVPYPGKYAEADMSVAGFDSPGKVTFVIPIHNRGDLDIVRARAIIDIYGPLNEKITSVSTNEISIMSEERKEVVGEWMADVPPGRYRAVATVIYDEKTAQVEKQFNVGNKILSLEQVEVNDFNLGQIAKFEKRVNNEWSESIVGAYAQMFVYNEEGEIMADFKSATYDIAPLSKVLMVAFWDTDGVRTGTYDASVFLKYGEQSSQQDLKLEVSDNNINVIGLGYVISERDGSSGGLFSNSLMVVLIAVIGVLVLINVIWFLVLRKRLKKK